MNTLTDFRHRRKFAAENGEEGGKKKCHGRDGADLILKVPAGTVIKDAESDKVIADMSGDNKRQVILKGGRGGQDVYKRQLRNHLHGLWDPSKTVYDKRFCPRSGRSVSGADSSRRRGFFNDHLLS